LIQPRQSATSSASGFVTLGIPLPFFASFSQTPSEES
jgi:hypothetical protein